MTKPWGELSRAERSAAYDNSGAVPGSAAMVAERSAQSAAFRAAHPAKLDLLWGADPRQGWDLFPAADPAAPCLVFIHGGYWQRNSREGFSVLAEGLLSRGWSVAFPGYRLAPHATLTQIVQDVTDGLDWLAQHGAAHGVAGPVVVSGWSAGGHLTAMALSHALPVAGLAISGVFELGPIRDTNLNEKLSLTDAEIAALSPLRHTPVAKPMAIAYGTLEVPALVHDSRKLHWHRADSGCAGALVPVAGTHHFSILDTLHDADGELARAAVEVLRLARR